MEEGEIKAGCYVDRQMQTIRRALFPENRAALPVLLFACQDRTYVSELCPWPAFLIPENTCSHEVYTIVALLAPNQRVQLTFSYNGNGIPSVHRYNRLTSSTVGSKTPHCLLSHTYSSTQLITLTIIFFWPMEAALPITLCCDVLEIPITSFRARYALRDGVHLGC